MAAFPNITILLVGLLFAAMSLLGLQKPEE